jgi:hypothetical protein
MGAFGKMKVTSSNKPRRRQLWARETLFDRLIRTRFMISSAIREGSGIPSCTAIKNNQSATRLPFWDGTNLSPKPWAIITVAVCFFSAGTMKGARDILARLF